MASINITTIYVVIMAVATVVVAALGKRIYEPIATMLGFADESINYEGGGAETYATVLVLLCIVTFCFYPWIRKQRQDAKNMYNLLFLTLISTLLVYQNQSFMRIQQYFSLVIMIVVPELIRAIDKNYRVFAYLGVTAFLVAYFIRLQPRYQFFFFA